MYPKSSHYSPDVTRWSNSLKRLKAQRIGPLNATNISFENKVANFSPKKKRSSSILKKAILNLVPTSAASYQQPVIEKQVVKTPELSIDEEEDLYSASSFSSLDNDDVEDVVQRLLDDEHSLNTDTNEEDYDDDILEQAVSRILKRKSVTCPNIAAVAASAKGTATATFDRPLPPLPQYVYDDDDANSSEDDLLSNSVEIFKNNQSLLKRYASTTKITATKGQVQLKRAATWLGLPVQKLLASHQVQNFGSKMCQKYNSINALSILAGGSSGRNNIPVISISNSTLETYQEEDDEEEVQQQYEQPFTRELIYGTDSDHFAFLRNQLEQKKSHNTVVKKVPGIINKKTVVTPKRIMYCRVMQIINLASTRDCDYELHIQLNNVTMATKRGILRKIEKNVSADRPQEEALVFEIEEPFSLNFIVAARHTNTVIRDGLAKMGIWPIATNKVPATSTSELPVAGFTCLNFENRMDVLDQGISRFRLTKPIDRSSNRWLNIELLIDIKVEEIFPAVVHRFPWSYATNELSTSSYQSSTEDAVLDPKELLKSQNHCRHGDYLTLYTRGLAHPTWKRYWVTMEENQLVLHDFTYRESKEPLSIIPLIPLQAVSKPSLDDCETVGIARKTGILLQFDRSKAMLTEPVRLDCDEGLEGKAYLYGDSEQNTIHWRRALSAYISNDDDNKNKTTEGGVDLRFLW